MKQLLRNIQANSIPPPVFWFEQEVVQKHKLLAFQDPDKISDALSFVWSEPHKWQKIAQSLGMPESDVKTRLKTIVVRRNQIVHEADIDVFTNNRIVIVHSDIQPNIDFIENLGKAMYHLVK